MSIIIDQQSFDSVDLEFDITPTSESVPVVVTTTLSRRLGPRARQTLLSPVPWGGVPGPSYILRSGGQAIRPELWVIYDEHGVQTSEGRDATDVASLCREDWQKIRDPVVARLHPKWAPELTRSLGHLSSMSFGRPPSLSSTGFTATPPDRGSFPLDHYGECKEYMVKYLDCLKTNGSTSTPCRVLGKDYLDCRMNRGLMERDDWKNLGMGNLDTSKSVSARDMKDTGQSNGG